MGSVRLFQYWRAVKARPSFLSATMNTPNIPSTFLAIIILFFSLTIIGSLIGGLVLEISKRFTTTVNKPDVGRIFISSILIVYIFFILVFNLIVCIGKRKLRAYN
jgi:hypothetical protein